MQKENVLVPTPPLYWLIRTTSVLQYKYSPNMHKWISQDDIILLSTGNGLLTMLFMVVDNVVNALYTSMYVQA